MKRYLLILATVVMMLTLSACNRSNKESDAQKNLPSDTQGQSPVSNSTNSKEGETEVKKITVKVNGIDFTAILEENAAARELVDLLKENEITLKLSDYSGFEKVGPLGHNLTTSNAQTTTKAGDIVLYNGNQIVLFYGSNSWSYTYLAHIEDLNAWEEALGNGDVTVVLSIK